MRTLVIIASSIVIVGFVIMVITAMAHDIGAAGCLFVLVGVTLTTSAIIGLAWALT